jgi:hypothetical protein
MADPECVEYSVAAMKYVEYSMAALKCVDYSIADSKPGFFGLAGACLEFTAWLNSSPYIYNLHQTSF